MPRKATVAGVGRGNAAGSRRTQFRDGEPSRNPKGRPRKPCLPPASSLSEAVQQLLAEKVSVTVGLNAVGQPIRRKMRRIDAIAESMVSKLGNASLREQTAFIRQLGGFEAVALKPREISETAIEDVLAQLAAEAEREIALGYYPDPRLNPRRMEDLARAKAQVSDQDDPS